MVARYRVAVQVSIGGQLHSAGTTVEAESGEVEHLLRLGYLVAGARAGQGNQAHHDHRLGQVLGARASRGDPGHRSTPRR